MKSNSRRGYTLVELMMVISILGVLASIVSPRVALVLERAYEGRAKGDLGAVRSALQLYYSDTEGRTAFFNHANGVGSLDGSSISTVLTPAYLSRMPVPYLADHFNFVPGLNYDTQAKINMATVPPNDIVFFAGPPQALLVNRPYVYDPTNGNIYYCNGNYNISGDFYYSW